MSPLSALDSQHGIADHATGAGAASAMAARAKFKQVVGPYVACVLRDDSRKMFWLRTEDKPSKQERCGCGRSSCAVDTHLWDMRALECIPGKEADIQHWLSWSAYRITNNACMGDDMSDLVLN